MEFGLLCNWFIWFHEFFWPRLFFNILAHCTLFVIWSQIESVYMAPADAMHNAFQFHTAAANIVSNFYRIFKNYNFCLFYFSDLRVVPLRIWLPICELVRLKYLFLNLCQMIFLQNTMILNNLQDMRTRLIKTILINKDYNYTTVMIWRYVNDYMLINLQIM